MSKELIQVWLYDENKKFVGTDEVFELGGNMTTTPLVFAMDNPTYNEELDTWFDKKEENKIDKMEVRLRQQEAAMELLATQIAKNTLLQGGK